MIFQMYMPTKIYFGPGEINKLGEINLPGKKALIVITSGKSMKANGYVDKVVQLLAKQNIEAVIFDKVQPNPTSDTVMEGAKVAKENNCDFVIGLGGGSSIDSAKSIAIMATNEGEYWDYIPAGSGKGKEVKNKPLPIIAITTTAGTGTEADPWTVITKSGGTEKIGYGIEGTFPTISIVDPEMMTSVPPYITAYTGIDALCHAVEGYLANISQPISDLLALDAVKLISQNLKKAVENPNDIEARSNLAWANTEAGLCETYSCCIGNHSIEHALSAFNEKLPHGVGLALVGPSFFEYILKSQPEKFLKLAKAMNPESDKPQDFITEFRKLIKDANLEEEKLSNYIKEEDLKDIAQNAIDTMGFLIEYMEQKINAEDIYNILKKAYN